MAVIVVCGGILFFEYFLGLDFGIIIIIIRILVLGTVIGCLIWWFIVLSPEERERRKRLLQKESLKDPSRNLRDWRLLAILLLCAIAIGLLFWVALNAYFYAKEKMRTLEQERIPQLIEESMSVEEVTPEEIAEDKTADLANL